MGGEGHERGAFTRRIIALINRHGELLPVAALHHERTQEIVSLHLRGGPPLDVDEPGTISSHFHSPEP